MPSRPPDPQALVDAHRRVTGDVRSRVLRACQAAWEDMGSWSDADADRLLARLLPVLAGGQRSTATATAAFLTTWLGARPAALDFTEVTGQALRGVDPAQVYRRPVVEARVTYARLAATAPSDAAVVDMAVEAGLRRLLGTADTDLQLTATRTSRQVLRSQKVATYRRVTRAGACGLCVAASDRVYRVADLMPIHSGCHCIVVPGSALPQALQRDGNDDDPTGGRGLRIGENAEIGPVLDYANATEGVSRKRTRKRGAGVSDTDRRGKRAQLAAYEKILADGGGTDWMRAKADELRRELND